MDGFNESDRIIVLAATNLENIIDTAMKRPGRFDRIIKMSSPLEQDRKKLFEYYL